MQVGVAYVISAILLMAHSVGVCAAGRFEGRVAVEWVTDQTPERDMRLLEPFAFVDASGKRWAVPSGAVVNGASIPQAFWSIAGSPYTGNYRRASVVHDYYCDARSETWQAVHRMFFDAMVAGGVDAVQAKTFYAFVYAGGPRWKVISFKGLEGIETLTVSQLPSITPQAQTEVQDWIRASNPSLDEIDRRLDLQIIVK